MHFYSMNLAVVMALPLKAFWFMNGAIDRIMAQKDMRHVTVTQMAQATPESVQEFRKALVIEAGTIVKLEEESPLHAQRDERGFAELKGLARLI